MAQAPPSLPPQMLPQQADPLAELRDIHLPPAIETWPPAPGWWLLAAIAVALLLYGLYLLHQYWRSNQYRREAIRELGVLTQNLQEHQDASQYLNEVQHLMKRVALTRFPRESVASLTGEAWVQFLDRSTGSHDFSMHESDVLVDANYRPDSKVDTSTLESLTRQWIKQHHPRHYNYVGESAEATT